MATYRKKPVVVEAVLYQGQQVVEGTDLYDLLQRSKGSWGITLVHDLLVTTVDDNEVRVPVGCYAVLDAKGYAYPCDAEIFEAGHEMVGRS